VAQDARRRSRGIHRDGSVGRAVFPSRAMRHRQRRIAGRMPNQTVQRMSQPAFSADNRSRTMKHHTARQCFRTAGSSLTFLVRRERFRGLDRLLRSLLPCPMLTGAQCRVDAVYFINQPLTVKSKLIDAAFLGLNAEQGVVGNSLLLALGVFG